MPSNENDIDDIIYEGERDNGEWFDEYRVISSKDHRLFKLLFGGNDTTIYRFYEIK